MKSKHTKKQQGFTLIELMVIVSIFAILTSVGLSNFKGFQSKVRLENLAYDVALLVRQAQNYGISVVDQSVFDPMNPGGSGGVGLHFVHGNDSMFVNEIILYQELGGNEGYYDTGTDRVIDTARLGSGSTISSICRVTISTCLNITDDVSISFTRPSPEPIVRRTQGSGVIEVSNSIKINLQEVLAGEEEIIFVQIAPTGQVSVGK